LTSTAHEFRNARAPPPRSLKKKKKKKHQART
jgi:hypothetical protein